ncbi:protein Wnt-7a-like [Ornithorhynchus anatinus]|uniref:protein Wnt-7a-like n=1 Tax=Ornithorhynchus anatinus TaxID=9258 RepID=UPI0010A83965|nr:protein Wnt-7a-like [Ornithorhynchus anatinus]
MRLALRTLNPGLSVICAGLMLVGDGGPSSVLALGANVICNRMPGLAPRQRAFCRSRPDAMIAIGLGAQLGLEECRYHFQASRWNCTALGQRTLFGQELKVGSRETAFSHAVLSAGVAYSVTDACSRGHLTDCGCDRSRRGNHDRVPGWRWGGCSADVAHGITFSGDFVDAREVRRDAHTLMNLHNNLVGRKVLEKQMRPECRCHGVSGSCSLRTCWVTLPSFRAVGFALKAKYQAAVPVEAVRSRRQLRPTFLRVSAAAPAHRKPADTDLVYVEPSPSYCEEDSATGSAGTRGRLCNHTAAPQPGSCELLCCGRGSSPFRYVRRWQCRCRFRWCCHVACGTCSEGADAHACN